uniref:NADH-ubiquinone oxidoreductase chain 4L n=1 Tax=Lucidina sp. FM13 TaxID=2596686 RepID=A0A5C0PWF4_9COLE|nr:NADH dehydrogenase subunit 4L [Lucidina sp. FM13]
MLIFMVIFCIMFIVGLVVFTLKSDHMLLMLLSMEFLVLTLYFGLNLSLNMFVYESNFLLVFLTMSVCEGVLGLSILVSMVRNFGNDYFNSLNILW